MNNPYQPTPNEEGGEAGPRKAPINLATVLLCLASIVAFGFALWDLGPAEAGMIGGAFAAMGGMGHFVYRWLPSRITVAATVLVIVNGFITVSAVVAGYGNLKSILQISWLPLEFAGHVRSWGDIVAMSLCFLGPLVFTPVHSFRPNVVGAVTTALGIGMWYGTSIMIMAFAG